MASNDTEIVFVLGDTLPTYYDVAISIFSVATKPGSAKMKQVILNYAYKLIETWSKAFATTLDENGKERHYVLGRKAVCSRIEKLVLNYFNKVYNVAHRTSAKHASDAQDKASIRRLNKQWKETSIDFRVQGVVYKYQMNRLFDISVNSEFLTGAEKIFYEDQKNARLCRLSQEIDEQWLNEQLILYEQIQNQQQQQQLSLEDDDDDMDSEATANNSDFDNSINRSGLIRKMTEDAYTQTELDFSSISQPPIRNQKNIDIRVKKACVKVSVKCNISTAMGALAVKSVCEDLYGHTYYLSKEEAIENDPSLVSYRDKSIGQLDNQGSKKPPTSKEDYLPYRNVLPSEKTLNDFKQLLAVQEEELAAKTLLEKSADIKCTLHYDTTSRSKIDGEWPSIIFSFSNKKRYVLRPLFFAYEDREQIVRLLTETYERLAILAHTTTKSLWEKTDILMTDSVEKNLNIEHGIADALKSDHIPLHFFCKAHTVEALDRSNIDVLSKLENALKFREALESINAGVKSFLRGQKSVVLCAINSILSFVSHDKSSTSTNQAELFDHILQREGKVKHLSLYHERRFTKLGYSCTSILDALPYIQMVLNETHLSNQHTEIVKMFLDSELLSTELFCLSYFTHKVSLPLLYAVEISNQDDLCTIFPKLYKDLQNGSFDTLSDYIVEYRHLPVGEPSSELEWKILKEMCQDAAQTIDRQCGREYGFGTFETEKPRATEVYKLPKKLRKTLYDTNNVIAERNLSVFDRKSVVAKYRNYKFKAKGIRNDMVIHTPSSYETPSALLKKLAKLLNQREETWTENQLCLQRAKVQEKMEKAKNQSQYVHKLLVLCKSWNGPTISIEELEHILARNPDSSEKIVKTELAYFKHTHRNEVIATPHLFRLIKVSHEERLSNLCVLLNGQSTNFTVLPKNEDALKLFQNKSPELLATQSQHKITVGEACITLWQKQGRLVWYVGYCVGTSDGGLLTVEHLHRVAKGSNLKWRYPAREDIETVEEEQILDCHIKGSWDVLSNRINEFTLSNHEELQAKFMEAKLI